MPPTRDVCEVSTPSLLPIVASPRPPDQKKFSSHLLTSPPGGDARSPTAFAAYAVAYYYYYFPSLRETTRPGSDADRQTFGVMPSSSVRGTIMCAVITADGVTPRRVARYNFISRMICASPRNFSGSTSI